MEDYPLIRKYGKHCKQAAHYISAQIQHARIDGAPSDAVHYYNGRWYCAADITSVATRQALGLPPLTTVRADPEEDGKVREYTFNVEVTVTKTETHQVTVKANSPEEAVPEAEDRAISMVRQGPGRPKVTAKVSDIVSIVPVPDE